MAAQKPTKTALVVADNGLALVEDRNAVKFSELEIEDVSLVVEYWSPEDAGETKIAVFNKWTTQQFREEPSDEFPDGEEYELECAQMFEMKPDDSIEQFANGSIRLVSALKNIGVTAGSMFAIVYKGRKKNKTNSNTSDQWDVKPVKRK